MKPAHRFVAIILSVASGCSAGHTTGFTHAPSSSSAVDVSVEYPFTPEHYRPGRFLRHERLYSFDEAGVLTKRGGGENRFNANAVAGFALALYNEWAATSDRQSREMFFVQVDGLLEQATRRTSGDISFIVWEYKHDNVTFDASSPYVSALAQGRSIAALLTAARESGDDKYLSAALEAFKAFQVPAREGGVATFVEDYAWYEEVADETAPSSRILNGHIFALGGLWMLSRHTGNEAVQMALERGIDAVRSEIEAYDSGYLSYYCQYPHGRFAWRRNYNNFHVRQLLWLYEITREEVFLRYALKFQKYDEPRMKLTGTPAADPALGVEHLRLLKRHRYWSPPAPARLTADLETVQEIDGVVLLAVPTPEAWQASIHVEVSTNDRDWQTVSNQIFRIEGDSRKINAQAFQELRVPFERVSARRVRVLIDREDRERLAFSGFAVLRPSGPKAVVANFSWYQRVSEGISALFGDGLTVPSDGGWLLIDFAHERPDAHEIVVSAPELDLRIATSNELSNLDPLGSTRRFDPVAAPSLDRYLLILVPPSGGDARIWVRRTDP